MMQTVMSNIGVVGAGRMGSDIAQCVADAGIPLTWICRDADEARPLAPRLRTRIERRAAAGLMAPDAARWWLGELHVGHDQAALSRCDLVIEAIPEDREKKTRLHAALDRLLPPTSIMASNSSSFTPQDLWRDVRGRDRLMGAHFFYPLKLRATVEVLVTPETDGALSDRLDAVLRELGRVPVRQAGSAAFAVNRTMLDVQAMAARLLRDGMAPADIDALTDENFFPGGIFTMMDAIGLDVLLPAVKQYTKDANHTFYQPLIDELTERYVSGSMGVKSGAGFYRYDGRQRINDAPARGSSAMANDQGMVLRCLYVNRALRFVDEDRVDAAAIDHALADVTGAGIGPLTLGSSMGRERMVAVLSRYSRSAEFVGIAPSLLQ